MRPLYKIQATSASARRQLTIRLAETTEPAARKGTVQPEPPARPSAPAAVEPEATPATSAPTGASPSLAGGGPREPPRIGSLTPLRGRRPSSHAPTRGRT